MACVALKRQLDFDPIQTPRPAKRRRCMPMCIPGSDMTSSQAGSSMFPAGMANGQSLMAVSPSSHGGIHKPAQNIQHRDFSYRKPRRLYANSTNKVFTNTAFSSTRHTPSLPLLVPSPPTSPSTSPSQSSVLSVDTSSEEKRIFNIKQVADMCAAQLDACERRVVREYTRELDARKTEQYDHFLRFLADSLTHDGTQSSYLS